MPAFKITETTLAARCLPPTDKPQALYTDTDNRPRGFCVVVGKNGRKTFAVRRRIGDKVKKQSIGVYGEVRDDGHTWTVKLAKLEAEKIISRWRTGDVATASMRPANGPTLREGLAIHVSNMRKGGGKGRFPNGQLMPCSERSIDTLTAEVEKNFEDWLDRPLLELTAPELSRICELVQKRVKPREGSVNPPGAALAKRIVSHIGAIWESTDSLHDLQAKNPARKVTTHGLAPKEQRLEPGEFKAWHAKVQELAPVRRDFNLLALFTAVRSEGLRHLTWDDVDFDERVIHVRRAKGNRPYSIPMTKTVENILCGRRRENVALMQPFGGDNGFVLPTVTRSKPFEVIPMAEAKEYELDDDGERRTALVGPHVLRKTWNSVAIEERVPAEDREALMNHEGRGVNVQHYGFPRNWDALRESAELVEQALKGWLKSDKKITKSRRASGRDRHERAAA